MPRRFPDALGRCSYKPLEPREREPRQPKSIRDYQGLLKLIRDSWVALASYFALAPVV